MKHQHHEFALIDNTYTASDARDLIITLLSDKIRFLTVQILSHQDRFGCDTEYLENRVRQLEADRQQLLSTMTEWIDTESDVEITSMVKMTVKQPSKVIA